MSLKLPAEALPLALAAAAGGLLAAVLMHLLPYSACPGMPKHRNAFVLAVRIKVKPGCLHLFKEHWKILADHCHSAAEPNTLSYELCTGEEDENDIIIYERYVTKGDLTGTHHGSQAFKDFGKKVADNGWALEKTRATYYETNLGFMRR